VPLFSFLIRRELDFPTAEIYFLLLILAGEISLLLKFIFFWTSADFGLGNFPFEFVFHKKVNA
jgi:hypothetical protein